MKRDAFTSFRIALSEAVRQIKAAVAAHRDRAEKAHIAKAFNDRYTYLHRYGDRLGDDFAWMCPECNEVHSRVRSNYEFLTGNHFPACCSTPEGHRHHRGIRVQS